jgi:hypothetical protein
LNGSIDLLGRGVAFLGFVGLAWEQDQLGLVSVETGDIGLKGFHGMVAATVVHGDTNAQCELAGDFGLLVNVLDNGLSCRECREGLSFEPSVPPR